MNQSLNLNQINKVSNINSKINNSLIVPQYHLDNLKMTEYKMYSLMIHITYQKNLELLI